jgi:5-(aminomethyl)-3-furanmethanol phosphate kinase
MTTPGFTRYGVDAVVKFGGSLLADEVRCRAAIGALITASRAGFGLLVLPGGGPTDKEIERLDSRHPFHPNTHHRACARAQDQTGLMISDPVFSDALRAVETLEEARRVLATSAIPVLLPSRIIFDLDPFERTWDLTSDAMGAWLAWLVDAPLVIILTDVEGLFPPDGIGVADRLIETIGADELAKMGHTAVDRCTAPFLAEKGIDAWILDGGEPTRLLGALEGRRPRGTHVVAPRRRK